MLQYTIRTAGRTALVLALVALALTAATTTTASAQKPGNVALTKQKLTSAIPGRTVGKAERLVAKRTPLSKVLRLAKPAKVPAGLTRAGVRKQGPDGPRRSYLGSPAGASGMAAPAATTATTQNGAWLGAFSANPNRQVGRLFFWTGTRWSHCTATAINSENKSVVVTAGHCVYNTDPDENRRVDGNGHWYQKVHFCPGYENGCKLGVWYARQMYTTNSWFSGTGPNKSYDWSDDVGIVLVSPNASGHLVSVVGGQGITFNQPTGLRYYSFGYPAADYRFPQYSYNGEDLMWCSGAGPYSGYGYMTIPCTMTGGASGGPWIISPNSQWFGFVNSVNSHKPSGTTMGGPYFGQAESSLFQYARAR